MPLRPDVFEPDRLSPDQHPDRCDIFPVPSRCAQSAPEDSVLLNSVRQVLWLRFPGSVLPVSSFLFPVAGFPRLSSCPARRDSGTRLHFFPLLPAPPQAPFPEGFRFHTEFCSF